MSHLDEGQLNALLDGELDEAARKAAEAHLDSCADCRREFTEARALMAGADDLIAAVDLPARSGPAAVAPKPRPATFRWRNVAWAASLLLAVGLGWLARADERYTSALGKAAKDEVAAADQVPQAAPAPAALSDSYGTEKKERAEPANRALASRLGAAAKQTAQPTAPAAPTESSANEIASSATSKPEAAAPVVARQDAPVATDAVRALTNPADKSADDARGGAVAPAPAQEGRLDRRVAEQASPAQAPAPLAASQSKEASGSGFLPASRAKVSGERERESGAFRATPMEGAVRILGGSIRLVDGMTPTRVLVGPGVLVSGADPRLEIVRVVYNDPPGRELWLDQQRPEGGLSEADRQGPTATTLLPGDTLVVVYKTGQHGLRWIHQSGFRLGLTGFLPADSLRALARRVQ